MGLSGKIVVVVKLTTDVIAIGCCILRWYIMRKQSRQTTGRQLSHILFALSILCEVTATILSTTVLLDGDRYIDKHGIEAGQKYLLNEGLLKITFWAHMFYYVAECILKAAYLAFYTDLYTRVQTKRRLAIWIATGFWAASYITAFLVLFTYCLPFSRNWRPDGTTDRCPVLFNVSAFFVLAGANILSDIAILIVPMLIISAMRLGRTEKFSLALVFSIGMISIAASVIRAGLVGDRFIKANHTWDTVWVWMLWSHAEMFFGVIAFTLPSFRYVLIRGISKVASSSRSRSRGATYGSKLPSSASRSRGMMDRDQELGVLGSKQGERGVWVETTVELKAESREVVSPSDSMTELTKSGCGGVMEEPGQRPNHYQWKIASERPRGDSL